ncbi:NAD(P)H-binding protein [Polaromonas sp. SM01]|uniref:NAD(P)H-binding protein n=1 Tax=Polaromonas sp. SM01 TaxID=3085630 RepID=UPI0029828369|nr:NAD(P)H-binding protein [Polaromonas sp. SM01]MDW5441753.1 NAD(P)H-binding protein [Polaromonas sp. SM01]
MTTELSTESTTLVLGGTGKTGRRVAQRLLQAGHHVRIASRHAALPFDWDNQTTWAPALQGIHAAYVAYQPDLAVPGAVATVKAFFRLAADSGVRKLVLLSGRGEVEAEQAEEVLQQTAGVDWTILRCSWFSQNFSESFFLDPILAGEVALPSGLAAEPFVDVEDIAEIAFRALTEPDHAGQLYEITGPEAISFADAIAAIASATGRTISFAEVPPQDYRAALVQQEVPGDYIELVMYLFSTVLDGRNILPGDGVQQALGRAPRSFADYVLRTASTGIWGSRSANSL